MNAETKESLFSFSTAALDLLTITLKCWTSWQTPVGPSSPTTSLDVEIPIEYLFDYHPKGVASVILSSTLPSASLWAREQHRMIRLLSEEDQEAITEAERTGHFDSPGYLAANSRFMERHCDSLFGDVPECVSRPKRTGKEAYLYGWGPNEYNPTGSLGNWEYTDKLDRITCPALIISGTDDLCTPLIAKTMYDRIPDARWELFEGCRHMCFVDDTEKYIRLLAEWLDQTEKNGCV